MASKDKLSASQNIRVWYEELGVHCKAWGICDELPLPSDQDELLEIRGKLARAMRPPKRLHNMQ